MVDFNVQLIITPVPMSHHLFIFIDKIKPTSTSISSSNKQHLTNIKNITMGRLFAIFAWSVLILSGCTGSSSDNALIYNGPGPKPLPPVLTEQDLKCAELGDTENIAESVFQAAMIKEDGQEFARLLKEFEKQNPQLPLDERYPYHIELSMVIPSDDAFERFYRRNPGLALKGDSLERFVKHHILVDFFSLSSVLAGNRRSTTLNYEAMPIKLDANTCIYFGDEESLVTVADDRCANGFIHTVEKVMVPW